LHPLLVLPEIHPFGSGWARWQPNLGIGLLLW
jgi:hypothetical protein